MKKIIEKVKANDNREIDPYIEKIKTLALNDKIDYEVGIILGSGLGTLGEKIDNPQYVDYADIPNEVKNNIITSIKL